MDKEPFEKRVKQKWTRLTDGDLIKGEGDYDKGLEEVERWAEDWCERSGFSSPMNLKGGGNAKMAQQFCSKCGKSFNSEKEFQEHKKDCDQKHQQR